MADIHTVGNAEHADRVARVLRERQLRDLAALEATIRDLTGEHHG